MSRQQQQLTCMCMTCYGIRDLQLATGAASASPDSLIRRFGAVIHLQFGILLFEIFHFKISCLPPRGYFVSLGLASSALYLLEGYYLSCYDALVSEIERSGLWLDAFYLCCFFCVRHNFPKPLYMKFGLRLS